MASNFMAHFPLPLGWSMVHFPVGKLATNELRPRSCRCEAGANRTDWSVWFQLQNSISLPRRGNVGMSAGLGNNGVNQGFSDLCA